MAHILGLALAHAASRTARPVIAPPLPCAALILAAAQLVPAPGVDRTGESDGSRRAFVELATPRTAYYASELVPLTLRVGVEADFLRDNVLQLFVQELDVPVQVRAPWLDEPVDAVLVDDAAPDDASPRFTLALGEQVVQVARVADSERDGRRFAVVELERTYLATRAGTLRIPAPTLRFAFATRFERDFFQNDVPVDWQLAKVIGEPLELRIDPLPEARRPVGFAGAVGRFTASADADRRDLQTGESFKLTLRIAGGGNLEFFPTPRFDELGGLHVLGSTDEKSRTARVITYDVTALTADVREVPALSFSFFDPNDPPGYRTLRTEPIPLRVRASATTAGTSTPAPAAANSTARVLGALGAIVVAVVAIWLWRKRRQPA